MLATATVPAIGFHLDISTPYDSSGLEAALRVPAEESAFRLVALHAPTGSDGGAWRCHFRLRAAHGVAGDAQIFDLLRRLPAGLRWHGLHKEPIAEADPVPSWKP